MRGRTIIAYPYAQYFGRDDFPAVDDVSRQQDEFKRGSGFVPFGSAQNGASRTSARGDTCARRTAPTSSACTVLSAWSWPEVMIFPAASPGAATGMDFVWAVESSPGAGGSATESSTLKRLNLPERG